MKGNPQQSSKDLEAFTEIRIDLSQESAQALVMLVDDSTIPGLEGYFETLYEEGRRQDSSTLFFYFDPEDSEAAIKMELLLEVIGADTFAIQEKLISKKEYLESYKEHYRAFSIACVGIVPSWKKGEEPDDFKDKSILYLDPGLAFGTGLHPTTRMCIRWFCEQGVRDLRIIDAGCGSGILSLAALLLGARAVLAFDIESNAVRATQQNRALTPGIDSPRLSILQGGFELAELSSFTAEIFVGNLTANIILGAKDRIQSCRFPRMVMTGILSEQKNEIISAFENHRLKSELEDDGWCLLELVKDGSI